MTMKKFGEVVKDRRQRLGLTLEKVAKKAGTHKGYISSIERGKVRPPSPKVLKRIARVLNMDYPTLTLLAWVTKAPKDIQKLVEERVGPIYF